MGRHGRFENFRIGPAELRDSNRIESAGRFKFESNLEAPQVPTSCHISWLLRILKNDPGSRKESRVISFPPDHVPPLHKFHQNSFTTFEDTLHTRNDYTRIHMHTCSKQCMQQHIPSLDWTLDSSIMSCIKSIPSELSSADAAYTHTYTTHKAYTARN